MIWAPLAGAVLLWGSVLGATLLLLTILFPRLTRHTPNDAPRITRSPGPPQPAAPRDLPVVVVEQRAVAQLSPAQRTRYWRTNLRLIMILLLAWAAGSYLPAWFASELNQMFFLGMPLGYFMGAQGALLVFLAITVWYARYMARYDQAYGAGATQGNRAVRRRLVRRSISFVVLLVGVAALLAGLERAFNTGPVPSGVVLIALTISAYGVIGLRNRAQTLDDYYVAGRRVPALFNGLALAADWMSAATFISLAGTLYLLGYEGLAYIMGWTGGYVLLALLLAPYLRKFGQYTVPDLIGARYGSTARITAAVITVIVSFTYLTAQVAGVGTIMVRFFGVRYLLGVVIGLGAVLFCSLLGGMKAVTWTQVVQGMLLIVAFLVPASWLSWRVTGVPLPYLAYGAALQQIEQLQAVQGVDRSYVEPFNDWTRANFLALTACLMCGTAGLPHILTRFYTTPTVGQARRSVGWALLFIVLIYSAIPAYAAFGHVEILSRVVGQPISTLDWARNWVDAGLLSIDDTNADRVLQLSELRIHPDLIVSALPEIVGLPHVVGALVAAGGLAAALSTADGLLMVITSAIVHDIYFGVFNQRASTRRQLRLGRLVLLVTATLAGLTALFQLGIIVNLVAWAFSLAAATLFPTLVLAIFWRRTTSQGAIMGMLCGLVVTLGYIVLNLIDPRFALWGITSPAAGIFGMPLNVGVTIIVSLLTPPPSPDAQALVDALRRP